MRKALASEKPVDSSSRVSPRASPALSDHADVFDAAPCGILVADEHGRIVDVNPRALRDLGYERAELLVRIEVLASPELARRILEHVATKHGGEAVLAFVIDAEAIPRPEPLRKDDR